jgi:hypothetical protein
MELGSNDPAFMAMMIGLTFVMGSIVVILLIVISAFRNRRARAEMLHRERMMALEKGLPVPPDYLENPKKRRPFVAGLVWAGIGLGAFLWGLIGGEEDMNAWGFIPFFVGIALLIGDWLSARRTARARNDAESFPGAGDAHQTPGSRS